MNPRFLVLDEPTAGLDPKGRDEILGLMEELYHVRGITIVLISHSMEDIARYADRLIVVNKGTIAFDDAPAEVFSHVKELEDMGLAAPALTYIMLDLKKAGFDVDTRADTMQEAVKSILSAMGKPGGSDIC